MREYITTIAGVACVPWGAARCVHVSALHGAAFISHSVYKGRKAAREAGQKAGREYLVPGKAVNCT